MKQICIFCGSHSGNERIFKSSVIELASLIISKNYSVIYGGGNIGLMGILADEIIAGNGKIIGVIPHFLAAKEVGHTDLDEMIFVDSMHQRKQKMAELADGFIALPGGLGTLEELAEILTWAQLGLIRKPVGILNIDGYYDLLIGQLDTMVAKGFLKEKYRRLVLVANSPEDLIYKMEHYSPPETTKYIEKDET